MYTQLRSGLKHLLSAQPRHQCGWRRNKHQTECTSACQKAALTSQSTYCRMSCSRLNWLLPNRQVDNITLYVCTVVYMHDTYECMPHCLYATCSACMHVISARLGIAFSAASFCVHLYPRSCHACRHHMSTIIHMLRLCAESALLMATARMPCVHSLCFCGSNIYA